MIDEKNLKDLLYRLVNVCDNLAFMSISGRDQVDRVDKCFSDDITASPKPSPEPASSIPAVAQDGDNNA